jgi:hypothetical protein
MAAGAEEPGSPLYVDRQGSGHWALERGSPSEPPALSGSDGPPAAARVSVLDAVVGAGLPLDGAAAGGARDGDELAVIVREMLARAAAASARERRGRASEAQLVRAKGEPKPGCSQLWSAKRRAAGSVFQPAAHGR